MQGRIRRVVMQAHEHVRAVARRHLRTVGQFHRLIIRACHDYFEALLLQQSRAVSCARSSVYFFS